MFESRSTAGGQQSTTVHRVRYHQSPTKVDVGGQQSAPCFLLLGQSARDRIRRGGISEGEHNDLPRGGATRPPQERGKIDLAVGGANGTSVRRTCITNGIGDFGWKADGGKRPVQGIEDVDFGRCSPFYPVDLAVWSQSGTPRPPIA